MRRVRAWSLVVLTASGLAAVPAVAADSLPAGVGWHALAGTSLLGSGVCAPDVGQMGYEGCGAVVNDWNGGAYDSTHKRLVILGGGHHGYFGNELYALQLDAGPNAAMIRLNDPTPNPESTSGWGVDCASVEALYDGRPAPRHTYGGVAYLPAHDRLWIQGGAGSPCGYTVSDSWTVNLANLPSTAYPGSTEWAHGATFTSPFQGNGDAQTYAAYDSVSGKIFFHTQYVFGSYDFDGDTFTILNDFSDLGTNIVPGVAIDPTRRLFVVIASGFFGTISIANGSDYKHHALAAGDCSGWIDAAVPGATYDPVADKIVGVTGRDNTLYTLDTATGGCTSQSLSGDTVPTPDANNGTFGRFQYADYCDCFVLVNDPNQPAYILRTRPGGGALLAAVSITPAGLSFGSELVGTSSSAKSVSLKNTGNAALAVATINASGDYSETHDCPATLSPAASCTIRVVFSPTAAGVRAGTLSVTDDASGSPHTIALTGTGTSPAGTVPAAPENLLVVN